MDLGQRRFPQTHSLKPAAGFLSSLSVPQHTLNVCICTSVFYCTCVVYHMRSTVYLAHMEPTSRQQASSSLPHNSCYYFSKPLYILYFSFGFCPTPPYFSLIFSAFLLSPTFTFCVGSLYSVHMPPPLPAVLFSLVSNHTRLEPAQRRSSTHGNHLKVLGSLPCFSTLCSFSHFPSIPHSPHYTPLYFPHVPTFLIIFLNFGKGSLELIIVLV